ncbi:MAG TPA: hypothetical protein VFE41_17470 [Acetobacteraceae bacterium]|jgi:hypothetical protein|nr:hypothetical protein [Acetobacteraceae bacterium]
MLRAIAIILGLALLGLAGGLALHTGTALAALAPGVMGALILLGTLFERYRYRRLGDAPPGAGWTDTGERFRDPETDATVAVFFHPPSGERRYVRLRP